MVVALIALFASLSGVAWAANTVGSSDVIDNSLQSVDLKDNAAVKSADVVNDSVVGGGLAAADLKPGSVGTSEVVNDSLTGADVSESSLGQVPSASNANTLDGVDSTGFLSTNGGSVNNQLDVLGDLVVSGGTLTVDNGSYIKLPTISGSAPASGQCDEAGEAGRVIVRTDGATPTSLYICTATGWVGK
jgi:hypothetical protein